MRPIDYAHWRPLFAIVLFAFLLRLAALVFMPEYVDLLQRQKELRNVAISLARTGDFANPYSEPTGKTAHLAPIGPLAASLVYRVFGISREAEFVRGLTCAIASSIVCGLTFLLGLRFGLDRRAALLAGILGALAPTGLQLYWDLTEQDACLGTLFFVCALLVFPWDTSERYGMTHAIAFGVASGLAVLSYESLLAPVAGLLACGLVVSRHWRRPEAWRFAGLATVCLLLVVLPWSVRNWVVFHRWVLVRSNFGLEFRLAQHPMGDELNASLSMVHPYNKPEILSRVRREGEPAVYHGFLIEGLDWIRNNPVIFAKRTIRRIVTFWFPVGIGFRRTLASLFFVVLAFVGVQRLRKAKPRVWFGIACIWLTYPLVYYLVPGYVRYRQPIEFTIYLMAALEIRTVTLSLFRNPVKIGPGKAA